VISPSHPSFRALTLLGQFRARLGRYTVGFGLLLAYQVAQYWFDTRLARAIDSARAGDVDRARWIALSLVAVAVLAFVVRIASRVVVFFAGRDAEYEVRKAFLAKLHTLGPNFYAQASTGDLMSRATNDLTQVRLLLGFGVLNVINTALALVSALSVMLSISLALTLASMAALPLLVVVTRAFAKRIFLRTRENQAALGGMSDTVQQSLSAVRVVRAYGLETQETERFEVDNTRVLERGLDLARLRGLMGPFMQAISAIGTVIVFWYGGWLLIEHRISAGGLLSFVRALARLTWPLIALGYLVAIVQRGRAAYERLRAVFEAETDPEPTTIALPVPGRPPLEVTNLTYRVGAREILKDVGFALQRGERVAIVGPTGSGKTTLARLLARALPAPFGSVYLDGREISTLPLSTVRQRVCYSQQVPFLFSTTVAENLAFALDDTQSEAARQASTNVAKHVRIHGEICQLVHGYDTVVGERGIQLSGGQRQRVALGRALLSRSETLILDDPTSAVDVATERALCDLFSHLGRERTIVIVTHRVSLASTCDRVIVLDQGRVVQVGSPKELAASSGLYRRFCDEQRLENEIETGYAPGSKRLDAQPGDDARLASSDADTAKTARERAMRDYHEEAVLASAFNWRLYRELLLSLRSERGLLGIATTAVLLVAVLGLLRPLFVRQAIDAAVSASDTDTLARLGLAVAALALFEQGLGFAQTYLTQLAGAKALAQLRHRVFVFLHRLPIAFFDKQPVGRLTTRVTNDIDAIQELFASGILSSFGDLIRLIGIVALMVSVNVTLSLAAFATLPVIVVLVLGLRRPMRNAFRAIRSQTARMNAALNEQISGMAVVQAFDKMRRSDAEFDRINLAHRDAHLAAIRYEAMQDAALETIASVALAAMVFMFGNSAASIGTLLAFQIYLAQFFEPLSQLTQRYTLLQSAMAGAERVFALLALPERDAVTESAPPASSVREPSGASAASGATLRPAVAFRAVDFAYHADVPVLHRVSFDVAPGEHVALVGPTGSGKSTIAALLIRLYEHQAGDIEVFGQSVRNGDVAWLRRQFAMVPQDPWLFRGTLLSNIAGADAPDRARAREVLERMRALEHFENKLGGLDAIVGSRGLEYSVGERQLVAFARALYRDAPILLLDEATASIDSETEGRLQRALLASLVGRTAIVIAHRLSTIKTADRILVLQQGRLVESGTHQQLLQADGLYRRLVALSSVRLEHAEPALGAALHAASPA
jgi:ATP-binding cassette subfamily B protein